MKMKNETNSKESLEQKIKKVYFLVHPAFASMCGKSTPSYLFKGWQKKIDEMSENEILIIFSASRYRDYKKGVAVDGRILKYAKKFGRRCFAFFRTPSAEKITNLLKTREFAINKKTIESEAFGEYYNLCVAGYASDYNEKLKFRKPTYINKELSNHVCDIDALDEDEKSHITFSKQNKTK